MSFFLHVTYHQKRHLFFFFCKVSLISTLFIQISLTFWFIRVIPMTYVTFKIELVCWLWSMSCWVVASTSSASSLKLTPLMMMILLLVPTIIVVSASSTSTSTSSSSSISSIGSDFLIRPSMLVLLFPIG